VLDKLNPESVENILRRALADRGVAVIDQTGSGEAKGEECITLPALQYLANIVDGDARSALNTLQILLDTSAGCKVDEQKPIGLEDVKEAARRSHVLYDRTGDQHYFMASALQKSIRGWDRLVI
jgi:putative ATPase